MSKIEVLICTYKPRMDVLGACIWSLNKQTFRDFTVIIVDNGGTLKVEDFEDLKVPFVLVHEPRVGTGYAKLTAFELSAAELLVWVDDDNELQADYLERAWKLAAMRSDIGCFGGRLFLPGYLWGLTTVATRPFLPYLAIKEEPSRLEGQTVGWGPWHPPGAGLVCRRSVARVWAEKTRINGAGRLGRRKRGSGFVCGEDSYMVAQAAMLGLKTAHEPELTLLHHLDPKRLKPIYLLRLLWGFGQTDVILRAVLGLPEKISGYTFFDEIKYAKSNLMRLGRISYRLGTFFERLRTNARPGRTLLR